MIKLLGIFFLVFGLIYLMYLNGWIPITVKSAVMFIGSLSGKKASFTSCNGSLKRIVKLEGNRQYRFLLNVRLTSGNMTVELRNRDKQTVMELNEFISEGNIYVKKRERYTLILRFHSATGEYSLDWR